MRKKCILVGGAGFLGTNVAGGLLSDGYDVTIVDKALPQFFKQSGIIDKVTFCRCDYLDLKILKQEMKGKDILLHFAYSSLPGSPIKKLDEDVRDNAAGSVKLFKLAVEAGVKKIIFPSSGGTVYGETDELPIRESSPTNPICFHGISKLMIEKYLFLFKRTFGIDYLIYRIANAYGPGQDPGGEQGLIANVIGNIYKKEPVTVFGKGDVIRDYVYIDDIVRAFILGIEKGLKNDIFNIGTGKGHSIDDVINLVSKTLSVGPKVIYTARRLTDVRSNILDTGKIGSAAGWRPAIGIEEGIEKTCRWFKETNISMAE